MIKQLITDLAHESITLSQALTRAKLVASKVKNETLKQWLSKELEGYDYDDPNLPRYRIISSTIYLTIVRPFGRVETLPITIGKARDTTAELLETHRVQMAIRVIEDAIKKSDSSVWQIGLTGNQVEACASLFKESIEAAQGFVRSGYKEVGQTEFWNIIEQTRQKLLDTLIDLDEQFPNLENDFTVSKDASEKVQNIVNNNVYGGNGTFNTASGQDITQTINNYSLTEHDHSELKSFGVSDAEVEDLKVTLATNKDGKEGLFKKSMKWLGSVTASMAGRGAYEHIDKLQHFVHSLANTFTSILPG